jgi:hypothetical protein
MHPRYDDKYSTVNIHHGFLSTFIHNWQNLFGVCGGHNTLIIISASTEDGTLSARFLKDMEPYI